MKRCGYNEWRDSAKPSQILARLCKEARLDAPHYSGTSVAVGDRVFSINTAGRPPASPTAAKCEFI